MAGRSAAAEAHIAARTSYKSLVECRAEASAFPTRFRHRLRLPKGSYKTRVPPVPFHLSRGRPEAKINVRVLCPAAPQRQQGHYFFSESCRRDKHHNIHPHHLHNYVSCSLSQPPYHWNFLHSSLSLTQLLHRHHVGQGELPAHWSPGLPTDDD